MAGGSWKASAGRAPRPITACPSYTTIRQKAHRPWRVDHLQRGAGLSWQVVGRTIVLTSPDLGGGVCAIYGNHADWYAILPSGVEEIPVETELEARNWLVWKLS